MNAAMPNQEVAGPGDDGRLIACLEAQRAACLAEPFPGLQQRLSDLGQLKRLVTDHREAIIDAISQDYGNRARQETLVAEILFVQETINFVRKRLRHWMKPQARHVDILSFPGAHNRVIPQPLGVVGIIVPWNFPLQLAFGPLVYAFAAGNRVMVKMSENSGALARLLVSLVTRYFPPEKLAFFEETGEVRIRFSRLPFNHLLFTGSAQTGRAVMAAAARNLTPVTLELGGKSPAVIAPDYPVKKAVERILFAKVFNAGQICVNVDYVFVPDDKVDEFVREAKAWGARHCPDINSPDYTSIIDQRAWERLMATLADARAKGATLVNIAGDQPPNAETRKLPPFLALDPKPDMTLLQREIFGPLLPVLPYREPREVVEYIRRGERPLSFYPFTGDRQLQHYYIERVMSGGVSVNDTMLHVTQHDLPFGGVGGSGMGHYHGREGFETFSKLRPVFYQARFSIMKLLAPPYGKLANALIAILLKLKS